VYLVADLNKLLKFGPADDLMILSTTINTWSRYAGLLGIIGIFKAVEVLVSNIAEPALGFSIYNPTTTIVYGFNYRGLAIAANIQWTIAGFSSVFRTFVIISRFDIAVFSVIISEFVSGAVVHYLLRSKTFRPEADTEAEWNEWNEWNERQVDAHSTRDLEMGLAPDHTL
jgi:hypothetical protein